MSDCHRSVSLGFPDLTERIGLLRPMPGGSLHGRGAGATGPPHAGLAFFHAVRLMACAKTSCGHDDQEVQQIREFSHLMEHVTDRTFQQLAALTGYHERVSSKSLFVI